jgi:hypothetical protein
MENRRESLVAFVLFIALLFFCILMGLVPLLAGTIARADTASRSSSSIKPRSAPPPETRVLTL